MRVPVRLGTVQRTLLVPLWARAEEAHSPAPLVRDPAAARIRERLDWDFALLRRARASRVGCCVRTRLIDRWVGGFLQRHEEATVVELGCGLDARRERLGADRPGVQWFDLDLPDVIALRHRFFEEAPGRRMLAAPVQSPGWLGEVAAGARGPVLVVTEGMLPYLPEADVRALFRRLGEALPGCRIVFDAMTALVVRHQRHHDAMRHFDARFRWAIADTEDFTTWDGPVRLEASRRLYDLLQDERHRLPRGARWLGRALAALHPPLRRAYRIHRAALGNRRDGALTAASRHA